MRKAFTGPGGEQKAEKVGMWLKALAGQETAVAWCAKNGVAATKASNESLNGGGGFLVPQDFDAEVFALRDTVGAFRGGEVRAVDSDNQVRPRRTGGLTANFVAEGTSIPESQMLFDAMNATMRKFGIFSKVNAELFEDSAPDLAAFFAQEIAYAFASKEDDVGFNGDGTSTYAHMTGLTTRIAGMKSAVNAASGHDTFLEIDATDLGNLMGGVLATAIPGAKWYCSALAFGQVFSRIASTSGGLVTRLLPDGSIVAAYAGFPIVFTTALPNVATTLLAKPMLWFGNLRLSSVIAEHRSARTVLALSSERYFDSDQIAIRGTRRQDIISHSYGDAATAGPIAALIGA